MENEIVDNTVTENVENINTENDLSENTVNEDLAVDTLASTLDYYDRYYENVLDNLNTIKENQSTIIYNQDILIEKHERITTGIDVLVFLIGVFLIYYFLRNMIIVK